MMFKKAVTSGATAGAHQCWTLLLSEVRIKTWRLLNQDWRTLYGGATLMLSVLCDHVFLCYLVLTYVSSMLLAEDAAYLLDS